MPRALVIAANSFVGRHLVARLNARGIETIQTARSCPSSEPHQLRACDLTRAEHVSELVSETKPDWIINLAGATTSREPGPMYDLHVGGTLNLLASAREHAPGAALILLGSAAEYGPVGASDLPIDEDIPARPNSFFGASKLAQTQAARVAAESWQLNITVLRPFNIIGPGLPSHYMPAAFARRLLDVPSIAHEHRSVSLVNGAATRDFVDVRDVAEAICRCAEVSQATSGFRVFNIASDCEVRIRDVANRLAELAGDFRIVDEGAADSRSNVSRSRGSFNRLRKATGWEPRIGWRESLTDMWRAMERPCEPALR